MANFGSIFPILRAKNISLEYPGLSGTTSHGILAPCQNLEKINDTIPRKRLDRQKDAWKDEQTLFYKTLPATTGGPKITDGIYFNKFARRSNI